MLALPRWKVILCIVAVLFGLVFTAPNLHPAKDAGLATRLAAQGQAEPRPRPAGRLLPSARGRHRCPEGGEAQQSRWRTPARRWRGKQIATTGLSLSNGVVTADPRQPGQVGRRLPGAGNAGRSCSPTARATWSCAPAGRRELSLSTRPWRWRFAKAVDQSIEIIRRRVDALGTREPSITRAGHQSHRGRGARRKRSGKAEGGDRPNGQAHLPDGRRSGQRR